MIFQVPQFQLWTPSRKDAPHVGNHTPIVWLMASGMDRVLKPSKSTLHKCQSNDNWLLCIWRVVPLGLVQKHVHAAVAQERPNILFPTPLL